LILLCFYPLAVLLVLCLPFIENNKTHSHAKAMLSSSFSENFTGQIFDFIGPFIMNIWILSFPIWFIGIMCIFIQFPRLIRQNIPLIALGFAGQLTLFLLAYFKKLDWSF